jgi:hypothetical protein
LDGSALHGVLLDRDEHAENERQGLDCPLQA